MTRRAILMLALLVPAMVQAEDMFRWRDAKGRVHYSNDTPRIPEGARPITAKLGEIGGTPIGPVVEPATVQQQPAARAEAPSSWTGPTSCVGDLGLSVLPHRSVDLDRRGFYDVDRACGHQHDLEGWLRDAATVLELRKIGS